MHLDGFMTSGKIGRLGILILLGTFLFLSAPALAANPSPENSNAEIEIPTEFGEVIYHSDGSGKGHLFVIGHSHRSAVTGANGTHTVRAQADAYRIGEWLIRNEQVQLLLPEGFFRSSSKTKEVSVDQSMESRKAVLLDDQSLTDSLADTSTFTNADILLKRNFDVQLQQVEDEKIYHAVGDLMRSAIDSENYRLPPNFGTELDFLQEIRTATMLQQASDAIDLEYSAGRIGNKKAIFTIGMAHLDEMLRFFRDGRIELNSPSHLEGFDSYSSALHLIEDGYGVTVILPRVLFDDQETLKFAKLGDI